jgi:hypothetical protein
MVARSCARAFLITACERQVALEVYAPAELPPCPDWRRHREQFPDHGYDSVIDSDAGAPYKFLRSHTGPRSFRLGRRVVRSSDLEAWKAANPHT